MEFDYDVLEKDKCWYKDICDHSRCGNAFCIRHYKMSALLHMALMEGKMRYPIALKPDACDLAAFRRLKAIKDGIREFVTSGKNLLLYSEHTGNGKTEWTKKLMLSWFDSIWPTSEFECKGLFISMPKFILDMKQNISKPNESFQYIDENILTTDLVVFDELNHKEWTPYEQDYMLSIISNRISYGKSCIYTTNYSLPIIEDRLGSRLASRIIGSSEKIEFLGSDKRDGGLNG